MAAKCQDGQNLDNRNTINTTINVEHLNGISSKRL